MQIKTNITRRDFVIARFRIFFRPGFYLWLYVLIALGMTYLFLPAAFELLPSHLLIALFLTFIFIFIFLCLVFTMLVISFLESFTSVAKRGVLGEHKITVSDEGFLEETAYNRTVHPWSSIDYLIQFGGLLLIRAGAGWHIIPKRSFSGSADHEQFLTEITRHLTTGGRENKA